MREANEQGIYANRETADRLHRIADVIGEGRSFRVLINCHRVTFPTGALFEIELEEDKKGGEVEIGFRWDGSRPQPVLHRSGGYTGL